MSNRSQFPARVLLVDDDEALLRVTARTLTRMGHVVHCAADGETAVGVLATGAFDVVVSDIAMPGMNGIDLLIAIRQVDLDVPIVLMTGAPEVGTAARAVEFGAVRYLTKPVDHDHLAHVLDDAVTLGRSARSRRQALELVGNMQTLLGQRAGLEARFARALDTLWMAYQPIVSWSTRRIYAYEALVRTGEPTLANPLALILAAEQLGRLHDLGRAVRRSVAAVAATTPCKLFVNLHSLDFTDGELYEATAPLSSFANQVVLEITERESLDRVPDVRQHIKALRLLGYQIAVDDLGAGYAGLTSVAQLQPDVVKIDMSLVRGIDQEPTKRILVGMMLGVASTMEMTVIAEGIETTAERDTLSDLGCDLLQGYLFARPGRPFPTIAIGSSAPPAQAIGTAR